LLEERRAAGAPASFALTPKGQDAAAGRGEERNRTPLTRDDTWFAGAVACPNCNAKPGEPCWSSDAEMPMRAHDERVSYVRRLADEAAETLADFVGDGLMRRAN
jgi:hypothetical protein